MNKTYLLSRFVLRTFWTGYRRIHTAPCQTDISPRLKRFLLLPFQRITLLSFSFFLSFAKTRFFQAVRLPPSQTLTPSLLLFLLFGIYVQNISSKKRNKDRKRTKIDRKIIIRKGRGKLFISFPDSAENRWRKILEYLSADFRLLSSNDRWSGNNVGIRNRAHARHIDADGSRYGSGGRCAVARALRRLVTRLGVSSPVVNSCSLFRTCSRGAVKRGRNVNKCLEQRPFQVKQGKERGSTALNDIRGRAGVALPRG